MKFHFSLVVSVFFMAWSFTSCQNDGSHANAQSADEASAETGGESSSEELTGKDLLQNLREQAVDADDKQGRIEQALKPIREEYAKSAKEMESLHEVKVEMGEDCILHIYNHANGEEEIRVDALKLDINGFSLIADMNPGELPGLRIRTVDGQAAVEVYRDGKLTDTREGLEIYMAERANIERITPAMVQLLRICRDLQ